MSKSILVIDTPKHCSECPLLNGSDECTVQDDDANFNASDSWDELMKGCPLREVPKKMKVTGKYNQEYFQKGGKMPSYKVGWNDCVDELTKNRGGNENGKSSF